MNSEVSVSIIIPTFNSEKYIAQAIESVLHQTFSNFEIILVDDASKDSTLNIVQSFNDPRIKILVNKENQGVSYSRNRGIKAAQGRWIGLLDSDDWYAPQRLEKLLSAAAESNADLIADDLFFIRDQQINCWSTLLRENQQESSSLEEIDAVRFVESDRLTAINAKRKWSLGYLKPLMRRKFLISNGIQYNEGIMVGEDFILYLNCLRQQARFYLLPEPYYYYRTRAISLSTRKPTEYLSQSCEITEDFIYQESLLPTVENLLSALSENLLIFQKRLAYYILLENIREKKVKSIIQQVFMKPYILDDVFTKIFYLLRKKLNSLVNTENREYGNINTSYPEKGILTNISK